MADSKGGLVKSGDILFMQGDVPGELNFLESGTMEILSAPKEFENLEADALLSKSKRVGVFKGKALIVGLSNLNTGSYKKSVRAIEDSQVTTYPLKEGGFKSIAAADHSQTVTILRQLYNRLNGSISDAGKFAKLYQNICMIGDNIALIYNVLSQTNAADNLDSKAEDLYNKYSSNIETIPQEFGAKFLITDNSRLLNKRYGFPGEPIEVLFKQDFCNFIKKLLKLEPSLFKAMIKTDPEISISIFDTLSAALISVLNRIESFYGYIDKELTELFGAELSWSHYLIDKGGYDEWVNSGKLDSGFVKNFLSLIAKLNSIYEEISGKKIPDQYPGVKKIHQHYSGKKAAPAEAAAEDAQAPAGIGSGLKRSIHQIFEFALIDKDFQNKFLQLLNEFKNMKNPFSTESDGRKIRRNISKLYWDLYKQVYIRGKAGSSIPMPARLMLSYGYLDEDLLEEGQVAELMELIRDKDRTRDVPVLFEYEFVSKIYSGAESPSITEMGLNYEAHLREQEKHRGKKETGVAEISDENIKKTMYEIEQRVASTTAVCSGSTATAFPILTSLAVKGGLSNIYVPKKKIEEIVKEIRAVDFSVFYRETVLKLGDARELIKEEVTPYFILLPIFGTRSLVWQELSGKDKRSRGRIVVPIFFMGDLKKSLVHTFASFRWELNRTVAGPMWADPIEGGVTGEYFDYVNTYKKNSNLSTEAKQKITERFKSLRTNRDRFADDYIMWTLFEKDGVMKLNSVVREMFYKHMPFNNEIREKIENMPAFSHAANRYKNIKSKTITGYERRYKKYQDKQGNYPEEIKKYMEFVNM